MSTRVMATEKANNIQPAMGSTKVGCGWQESVNEATTQPQRWVTTNDESVWRMMIGATKRARVKRAMMMAMRVAGDKEGKGDDKKDGVGDKGGVQ